MNPCNLQHVKETKEDVSQPNVVHNANNIENKANIDSEYQFGDSDTMIDLSNKRLGNRQESMTEENEENDVGKFTNMTN